MKVELTCNLKCKAKLWRKGTVLSGPPFPSDIAEELQAVLDGRSDTLFISEVDETPWIIKASDEEFESEIHNAILFRKFDKPILNRVVYRKPEIQYDSRPWFFHQHGAKEKRKLLLRKF